jgi:hypothetical protein
VAVEYAEKKVPGGQVAFSVLHAVSVGVAMVDAVAIGEKVNPAVHARHVLSAVAVAGAL